LFQYQDGQAYIYYGPLSNNHTTEENRWFSFFAEIISCLCTRQFYYNLLCFIFCRDSIFNYQEAEIFSFTEGAMRFLYNNAASFPPGVPEIGKIGVNVAEETQMPMPSFLYYLKESRMRPCMA